ncbi:translocon subunit [Phlyctochytrium bullatum]|nr:translocon subunit [Phlyctochytrium bullatum]
MFWARANGFFAAFSETPPRAEALRELPPGGSVPGSQGKQSRCGWIALRDKILYSMGALACYLICSHIPLYGVLSTETSDPMHWMRVVLGSTRGTLMELGISPLVTSAMVLQLLAGLNLIEVDYSVKEERALFGSVQKLFAFLIAFVQASILVISGVYGEPTEIGAGVCGAIMIQLLVAAIVTILLDELLQKGYGLGSGISLFVSAKVTESVFWKAFSPISSFGPRGYEYEGALMSLLHLLFTRKDKFLALKEAVFRSHLPNVSGIIAAVLIFGAMIYVYSIRYEIRVTSNRVRGQGGNYPIKLLYTGAMPLVLQTAVLSNIYFVSQVLFRKFPNNILVRLIGVWTNHDGGRQQFASGGLVYYVSPPQSLLSVFSDPLQFVVYTAFVLAACAYISRQWMEVSGTAPRDIAKLFHDQQISIQGHRDSNAKAHLAKVIPPIATLGGLALGALAVGADLLSSAGSGVGVVLAVAYILQYIEIFARESQESPLGLSDLF